MSINSALTAVADAIRYKTGKTGELSLDQMAAEINGINTGSGDGNNSGAKVYIGEVTPNAAIENITVEHGLGTTDLRICACIGNDEAEFADGWLRRTAATFHSTIGAGAYDTFVLYDGIDFVYDNSPDQCSAAVDENTFKFYSYNDNHPFATCTYTVVIVAA